MYCYENKMTFPIYASDSMDLLLLTNGDKSHYVYIKEFDRYFCKSYLQCFSSKHVLTEHKKVCLSINGVCKIRKRDD